MNPASTLLQDLLKEQRAHRYSRGAAAEDWQDDGSQATEEGPPMPEEGVSDKARKANDVFSAGVRQPKEMGMREMDQVCQSCKSAPAVTLTSAVCFENE